MSAEYEGLLKVISRQPPGLYRERLVRELGEALARCTIERIDKALDEVGLRRLR